MSQLPASPLAWGSSASWLFLSQVRGIGASLDYFQFCPLLRFPVLPVTTLKERSGQWTWTRRVAVGCVGWSSDEQSLRMSPVYRGIWTMNTDERTQGGRPKWRGVILASIFTPRYSILPPPPFPEEKLAEAISFCTSLSFIFCSIIFYHGEIHKTEFIVTSLVVQWLRPHAFNAGGVNLNPGQGTKILHVVQQGKNNYYLHQVSV